MKRIGVILVALAVMTGAVIASWAAFGRSTAEKLCDAKTLYTMAGDALRGGDEVNAAALQQAAEKCEAAKAGKEQSEPTTTATPSATQSASPSASPTTTAKKASVEEFLANRPAKTKSSKNAFGPKKAILPSLHGKDMEDLSASQAKAELVYVTGTVDRMQTADKALDLGIVAKNGDKNQVNTLTKRFVDDRAYWLEIRAKVVEKIQSLTPSIKTVTKGTKIPGMSYSFPGDPPKVGVLKSISFSYDTKWLVLKDAKGKVVAEYRLECHFQHGGDYVVIKTPPGTTITPEGEIELLVNACRLVNGTWKNVYGVEHRQGDLPVNNAKCKPEKPTPTPTPTTEKPTPTPTPTTEKPCQNKECETPVSPPPNRPKPTTTPTRSPETTPPARPSQPASTATPTVRASGATKAPTPSKSASAVPQPTVTNTGDPGDPDDKG